MLVLLAGILLEHCELQAPTNLIYFLPRARGNAGGNERKYSHLSFKHLLVKNIDHSFCIGITKI